MERFFSHRNAKRIFAVALAFILAVGLIAQGLFQPTYAAVNKTVRYNVSASRVTGNYSKANLPTTASSLYTGKSYYFNMQTVYTWQATEARLYIKAPGGSYSCVGTEKANNYFTYVYLPYKFTKAGTYQYYWMVKCKDDKKTYKSSTYTLIVKSVPAPSKKISCNVSVSHVSGNYETANLPASASSLMAGNRYYFNMQTANTWKATEAKLYIKASGGSYSCVGTETAQNYFTYAYLSYKFSKSGSYQYYWSVKCQDDGKTYTSDTKQLTVKAVPSPVDPDDDPVIEDETDDPEPDGNDPAGDVTDNEEETFDEDSTGDATDDEEEPCDDGPADDMTDEEEETFDDDLTDDEWNEDDLIDDEEEIVDEEQPDDEDYVENTTPDDDSAGISATFTAGQASYTSNGQHITMDAAPYIDRNNRMMVPIRYAANAMGVTDTNILWNGYTQTATISGAIGVIQVKVGSTSLVTSNGMVTMDTVAVNKDGRIYVPVRYIANALGANVSWDQATRTATFSFGDDTADDMTDNEWDEEELYW